MTSEDVNLPQKERLSYLEARVRFFGTITRAEIMSRFDVGGSCATRDLALYQQLAPDNLVFDVRDKIYKLAPAFSPLFAFNPHDVFMWLAQDVTVFRQDAFKPRFPVVMPYPAPAASLDILACITRAICRQSVISVEYRSLSSGLSSRELVPLALASNGFRYHVRAYDRLTQSFRDFVLSRFESVAYLEGGISSEECISEDHQWQRMVDLELVPHPDNIKEPITIAKEYEMNARQSQSLDGDFIYYLSIKVRAALVGYLLRHWNVDCTPQHMLRGPEYHLWLSNPQTLYGVENVLLAPGYVESVNQYPLQG